MQCRRLSWMFCIDRRAANSFCIGFRRRRNGAVEANFNFMKKKAYARAGVDIDLGNRVKARLPRLLASTHRPEVLGKVGGFGGLFALDTKKYKQPVLVSSTDGVGTK